jgi:hypothetical protein
MKHSLSQTWTEGRARKEPFLERARKAAAMSLPYLAPREEGQRSEGESYPQTYSSRAARGVVNLASKLTTGLFDPTAPFVRFEPDLKKFTELEGGEDLEKLDDLVLALSRRARAIDGFLDGVGWRARSSFMFQHLIVSGNYLIRQLKDGAFVGYGLDSFQVERDGVNRVRHIIIREVVPRAAVESLVPKDAKLDAAPGREDHVVLWTGAEVVEENLDIAERRWNTWQEVGDGIMIGEKVELANDDLPLLPIRFFMSDDDYGRSIFDMIQGEVEVVEGLTQALAEDAAMAAQGVWRIDPASGVDGAEFEKKRAGQHVYAKDGQIGMVRADKGGDLVQAAQLRDGMDRELASIFLSFLPRDAERVTAQEIQRVTQELNEAFGGAFALLSLELQLPIARLTEKKMIARGDLDKVPVEGLTRIKVITGIDAIGRGRDEIALQTFYATIQTLLGPEEAARRLKVGNNLNRLAAALGIDPEPLVYSDEEFAEQEAQRQEQDLVAQIAPQAVGPAIQQAQQAQGG